MNNIIEDLTNKKFGRWTVLERAPNKNGAVYWKCKCDCGAIKEVKGSNLRLGNSKSCGCLSRELSSERMKIHGGRKTRLYEIWYNMRQRCYNSNIESYKNYGGRGIIVCNEWKNDFVSFRDWALSNGYTESLTLDRIDVNKNYCPENCRWVSQLMQQNNRSNNHYITYNNQNKTLAEWARELNFTYKMLEHRINRGWTVEEAFTIPKGGKRKKKGNKNVS